MIFFFQLQKKQLLKILPENVYNLKTVNIIIKER